MQRVRVRSKNPCYLLAALFDDGLKIKKKERTSPRKPPRKIKTERPSILTVVFMYQN